MNTDSQSVWPQSSHSQVASNGPQPTDEDFANFLDLDFQLNLGQYDANGVNGQTTAQDTANMMDLSHDGSMNGTDTGVGGSDAMETFLQQQWQQNQNLQAQAQAHVQIQNGVNGNGQHHLYDNGLSQHQHGHPAQRNYGNSIPPTPNSIEMQTAAQLIERMHPQAQAQFLAQIQQRMKDDQVRAFDIELLDLLYLGLPLNLTGSLRSVLYWQ
jgi:hypothetical protein